MLTENKDESPRKGLNTVVSCVHFCVPSPLRLRGDKAVYHFDNCACQIKNKSELWYALWRAIVG